MKKSVTNLPHLQYFPKIPPLTIMEFLKQKFPFTQFMSPTKFSQSINFLIPFSILGPSSFLSDLHFSSEPSPFLKSSPFLRNLRFLTSNLHYLFLIQVISIFGVTPIFYTHSKYTAILISEVICRHFHF